MTGGVVMGGALERHSGALQTQGLNRDLKPMNTPVPKWMPAQCRLINPSWVQRKAVTVCKRDQKRGGTGNVQQYRLAIHDAVLASEGRDHWTGEPLDWELISTYYNHEAAARKRRPKSSTRCFPPSTTKSANRRPTS